MIASILMVHRKDFFIRNTFVDLSLAVPLDNKSHD